MRDSTSISTRCTIQRRNGEFCDAPAMEDLPYSVCGPHALRLLRHMIAIVDAEFDGLPGVRRLQAALDSTRDAVARDEPFRVGVVYYLLVGGLLKIGWTGSLNERMRGYPPDAQLLATEPGSKETERERHQQFRKYLSARREWFTPGPELRAYIEALPTYTAAA